MGHIQLPSEVWYDLQIFVVFIDIIQECFGFPEVVHSQKVQEDPTRKLLHVPLELMAGCIQFGNPMLIENVQEDRGRHGTTLGWDDEGFMIFLQREVQDMGCDGIWVGLCRLHSPLHSPLHSVCIVLYNLYISGREVQASLRCLNELSNHMPNILIETH